MFENLSERLERSFKLLKGQGRISEINIAESLKDVRKALVEADVNYKVAKTFIDTVKQKAIGENVIKAVNPSQMIVKIVRDELAQLMGGTSTEINLKPAPAIILVAGLQGSGKTTFCGKLANTLKKKGRGIMLIAGDIYRPAAVDQLTILAEQIGVQIYSEPGATDAVALVERGVKEAKAKGLNTIIVDTAGRLAIDEKLMMEITSIKKSINPAETLFVVDSMTGQDAVNTAKEFNDRLDFDGVVLTKLDGDTRGGAAISIRTVVDKPLKYMSLGEKMDTLEVFHPDRMADRILGMGDIVSLVEKAQEQFDEEAAKKMQAKLRKNEFTLTDFLAQIQQVKKMGNIKDLASMIPGVGKAIKNLDIDNSVFNKTEAIIYSMTPEERQNPALLNSSRKTRIAKGSGTDLAEINKLLKQFQESSKMMKMVATGGLPKMPRR